MAFQYQVPYFALRAATPSGDYDGHLEPEEFGRLFVNYKAQRLEACGYVAEIINKFIDTPATCTNAELRIATLTLDALARHIAPWYLIKIPIAIAYDDEMYATRMYKHQQWQLHWSGYRCTEGLRKAVQRWLFKTRTLEEKMRICNVAYNDGEVQMIFGKTREEMIANMTELAYTRLAHLQLLFRHGNCRLPREVFPLIAQYLVPNSHADKIPCPGDGAKHYLEFQDDGKSIVVIE